MNDSSSDLTRRFVLARWLFLRALAATFAIAFISLWVQVDGLVGSRGILPIAEFLASIRRAYGEALWYRLPTLCWLSASDAFLHVQCALGVLCSVLLFIGIAPRLSIASSWLLYLSLSVAGQDFFSFQWDVLLLETALFALFLAPGNWRPGLQREREPTQFDVFVVRALLFRLMLASGLVKLASGDPAWLDKSALTFHYFTQPIPNPISWWMSSFPHGFHVFSCWLMFAIEIILPFACFGPRIARLVAAVGIALLMLLIAATGNYGFFNLVALVLCITLVDDEVWARVMPRRFVERSRAVAPAKPSLTAKIVKGVLAFITITIALFANARRIVPGVEPPEIVKSVEGALDPLRSLNAYGLFAVMTRARPEIVIEGTDDGITWLPYEFRWKPGDVHRAPPQIAPHMPRVDWQMWFAALGRARDAPFVRSLCRRLLEGSPPVLNLFAANPFPDHPPKSVRARLWDYRFTTREERAHGDGWWQREESGMFLPPMTLSTRTPFPR